MTPARVCAQLGFPDDLGLLFPLLLTGLNKAKCREHWRNRSMKTFFMATVLRVSHQPHCPLVDNAWHTRCFMQQHGSEEMQLGDVGGSDPHLASKQRSCLTVQLLPVPYNY